MNKMISTHRGFTLVEMAIVLVMVGLLVAAFLSPLTTQFEQTKNIEARRDIQEIKEALIGFALSNLRLPCPDTTGDGIEDVCTDTLSSNSTGGNLAWLTLGLKSTDPWGRPYQYRVNNAFSTNFNLNTTGTGAGILRICSDNGCTVLEANNVPAVIYSSGRNGHTQPPVGNDEIENTAVAGAQFDRTFVNHEYFPPTAPNGEFDDIMGWLSSSVLMGQMVMAGQLP